ncbi:MAG: T9SS type A sorting domain-containing protein [Bacteroidales bacterium]|nr:T9SS type A sorting domain-containing protein [Bacteroidales bacterium]
MMTVRKLNKVFGVFILTVTGLTGLYSQEEPLFILPLGNSITYGSKNGETGDPGYFVSYRYKLYQLLNQAGYDFDFIGHHSSGYSVFSDASNGGFPGIRDNELANVLQTGIDPRKPTTITPGPYLNYISPDMILLHIGTNDVRDGQWADASPIGDILDAVDTYETTSGKPVLVLVSQIISFKATFGECNIFDNLNNYNSQITTIVNNRIAGGDKLILVPMQCGADINYNSDMADDLHPNSSGEDKMGIKWFEVIDNINSAPVVTDIPDQSEPEGQSFTQINLDNYISDAEDIDADISWSIQPGNPQYLNVSINSQRIATITPKDSQWNGSETITFIATDNGKYITKLKKSAQDAVTFTVTPVNNPPVILSQKTSVSVVEDKTVEILLSHLNVYDSDSDPGDLSLIVQDGTNYTHTENIVKPDSNLNGQINVNVVVSDGIGQSDVFPMVVDIIPVNDPPVITGQTPISIQEESQIEILKSYVSVTDVDNDYPSQHTLIVNDGLNYTRTGNTVKPNENYFGTLSVPVKVQDPYEASQVYNFSIEVTNLEDPPQITLPVNLEANEGELYYERILVSDPDSNQVTISSVSLPGWLNLSPNPGELYGTPGNENIGDNYITVRAYDGTYTVDTTFIIKVTNTNDPPVFTSTPVTDGDDYEEYYYKLTAIDPDDDPLTLIAITIPRWASFNKNTGELTGMPKYNDPGEYMVKLCASDGIEDTIQQFTITVTNRNDTPKIVSVPRLINKINQSYTYVFKATDPDEDDILTYICLKKPSWLSFVASSGIMFGIPSENDVGDHDISLAVSDSKVTVTHNFTLKVVTGTSVDDIRTEELQIYPVPANRELNLRIGNLNSDGFIEFTDMQGKIHLKSELPFSNGHARIDLNHMPSGIYLFRISFGDRIYSGKIIINRRL